MSNGYAGWTDAEMKEAWEIGQMYLRGEITDRQPASPAPIPQEFYCYGCCGDSRSCSCEPLGQAGDAEYWNDLAVANDDELKFYDNAKMQEHINQVEAGRQSNQLTAAQVQETLRYREWSTDDEPF